MASESKMKVKKVYGSDNKGIISLSNSVLSSESEETDNDLNEAFEDYMIFQNMMEVKITPKNYEI